MFVKELSVIRCMRHNKREKGIQTVELFRLVIPRPVLHPELLHLLLIEVTVAFLHQLPTV